jgi:peptidylprolyl isomerase
MKLRLIAAAVASLALASGALAQQKPTDAQALSYLLGYSHLGTKLPIMQHNGETIDIEWVIKGVREGMKGSMDSVQQDQLQQVAQAFQQREQVRKEQAEARYEQLKQQNKQKSEEFLAANAKQPGVTELEPGVQYRVITAGSGAKPSRTDKVTLKVKGPFAFGERNMADATEHSAIAVREIYLKGIATALTHMPAGSTWEITLGPEQAYGDNGGAPNVVMVFEVTLLAVEGR